MSRSRSRSRLGWFGRLRNSLKRFLQTPPMQWAGLFDQHPELEDIEHVLSVRSDDQATYGNDYDKASDDFAHHVWVQKAVRIWGDSIAPLLLRVEKNREAITHPLNDLLASPNEDQDSSELWRWWATDMALGGEHGLEFVSSRGGQIRFMYPRQPDFFHVRPDASRARYWKVAEYLLDPDSSDSYTLTPDEFLHFKFYNPLQPYRGIAPSSAVRLSVIIDQLVQAWSRMFFTNSARPDYAVVAPQGLTKDEREYIELALATKFGGAFRSHLPIVLEQGITDIKTFSYPRTDSEWIAQRRMSRDEVGAIWGVPDEVMGYGKDTYENFDTAERVLWTITLVNLIDFRDRRLTHFFRRRKLLAPDERVATDLSRVWALRRAAAVQMRDAERFSNMGVPFNTIDEKLGLGIGPVPGGDQPRPTKPASKAEDDAPPRSTPEPATEAEA